MLPEIILYFYFWYFIIPSHQTQILHCKLTVVFVMVDWLLLTPNIKTLLNMHKTYLQNSRQWFGLRNTAASIRLSAQFPLHTAQCGNTSFKASASPNAVLYFLGNCNPPSMSVSIWDITQHVLGTHSTILHKKTIIPASFTITHYFIMWFYMFYDCQKSADNFWDHCIVSICTGALSWR